MKRYIGRRNAQGTHVVVVDHEGDGIERPLRHHVRHSPTGFEWGYGGSGPADLARCILIDHFGDEAKCSECDGRGTVSGEVTADHILTDTAPRERCWECAGEGFKLPVSYQDFKFQVVGGLDRREFELSAEKIAEWLATVR